MTTLQSIKELQRLCRKGKLRTWEIGQTSDRRYTGSLRIPSFGPLQVYHDTLREVLQEILKRVKELSNE